MGKVIGTGETVTDFIIRDGQHRCCVLLHKYGPEHEIDVVHFW